VEAATDAKPAPPTMVVVRKYGAAAAGGGALAAVMPTSAVSAAPAPAPALSVDQLLMRVASCKTQLAEETDEDLKSSIKACLDGYKEELRHKQREEAAALRRSSPPAKVGDAENDGGEGGAEAGGEGDSAAALGGVKGAA